MTAKISMFTSVNAQCAATKDLFGTTPVQHYIKDEVVFKPSPSPYLGLQKATERLQSGKSIFFDSVEDAQKVLTRLKHS